MGLASLALALTPLVAHAEGMTFTPSLSQNIVWDSNPLMLTQDVKEIFGESTLPRVAFLHKTQTAKIGLDAWIENSLFNRHAFDSTDYHGVLDLAKETQRLSAALRGAVDYDTTRTSELTNAGTQTTLSRHFGYSASPTVAYNLSPLSKVELTGDYTKATYDKNAYVDYHTLSLSPSYVRAFTELYSGIVALNARRYESDEGRERIVDSIGPVVGVLAKLTPRFSTQFRVGAETSRQTDGGAVTQDWSWSTVFSSDLMYKGDQDTVHFIASRAQQAYGNGSNGLLTSLDLREERQINENFSANVGLGYQLSNAEKNSGTNLDSRYVGDAGLTYHATSKLDVAASYRYRNESYTDRSEKAEENIARVGLTYRPKVDGLF